MQVRSALIVTGVLDRIKARFHAGYGVAADFDRVRQAWPCIDEVFCLGLAWRR